jgi:NAD(P)-dependent dehydrogenase (short-subunit alcohol dehydrogenase family)
MALVVSGGTRGIGLEIAARLAKPGETAVLGYRGDHDAAEVAVDRVSATGTNAIAVPVDLSTPGGAAELVAAVPEGESIGQLVHCAVQLVKGPALDAAPTEFQRAVTVNGMALYHLVHAASPRLERGSLVLFVTSRGGRVVVPADYAAVGIGKATAEAIVRYLAVELGPRGVRVNAISPGVLDTGAVRSLFGERTDEILAAKAAQIPMGRGLEHEDYLGLVEWLASPAAEMVTGALIPVYGGADLLG